MVKSIQINFSTLCTTLDEVEYVEIFEVKFNIGVIIIRQKHQGKLWFIISCPFLKPGIGIKISSTAELFHRAVIIISNNTISTMQGQSLKESRQKCLKFIGSI